MVNSISTTSQLTTVYTYNSLYQAYLIVFIPPSQVSHLCRLRLLD